MLQQLHIRNYLLIREINLEFQSGYTAITGETGSGKSLIIGALGLILGERANTGIMKDKDQKCIIEGTFNVSNAVSEQWFNRQELDYEQETIIRREISPSGKSRGFINDTPVGVQVLKDLGVQLVDIHGQNENQTLLKPKEQLLFLDRLAGNLAIRNNYAERYHLLLKQQQEIQDLTTKLNQAEKERAFHEFQLQEINEADISDASELEEIEGELNKLEHAEQIKANLHLVNEVLEASENGINSQLSVLQGKLGEIGEYAPEYKEFLTRLNSATVELSELARDAFRAQENIEWNPKETTRIKERVNTLNELIQKHQVGDLAGLLDLKKSLNEKLQSGTDQQERLDKLTSDCTQLEKELHELGLELRKNRKQFIPQLVENLQNVLLEVSLPNTENFIELNLENELGPDGLDTLQWKVRFNKGSRSELLQKSASGGELGRYMLCLKYLLAEKTNLPCIILDEIDSGVSGDVALKVGQLLERFGQKAQLLAITHLPQVAGKAQHHYKVSKTDVGDETQTQLVALSGEERVNELAEMIAGKNISNEAVASARILMKSP